MTGSPTTGGRGLGGWFSNHTFRATGITASRKWQPSRPPNPGDDYQAQALANDFDTFEDLANNLLGSGSNTDV